jgi:hypothetical protein
MLTYLYVIEDKKNYVKNQLKKSKIYFHRVVMSIFIFFTY